MLQHRLKSYSETTYLKLNSASWLCIAFVTGIKEEGVWLEITNL
jgi:hypothetical protein